MWLNEVNRWHLRLFCSGSALVFICEAYLPAVRLGTVDNAQLYVLYTLNKKCAGHPRGTQNFNRPRLTRGLIRILNLLLLLLLHLSPLSGRWELVILTRADNSTS